MSLNEIFLSTVFVPYDFEMELTVSMKRSLGVQKPEAEASGVWIKNWPYRAT